MSTTKTSAQVPKLRFPGFEGEWKAAELGYYTQTITSGSRDWAQYYAETGSKFVRMTNLPRGGIQLLMDDMRYVALPEDSSEGTRTSLQAEDILISITAELGKIGWIPPNFGEAYINQHTALVRLDHTKVDSRFVAHSLSSERMNRRINRLNDAGAKAGLNLPTIRSLDTVLPTLPEQQKIAAFLTAVDGRIGQLSRKKALLEATKKGVMQQLFTQTLRFQDDHGHDFPDWEEKPIGESIDLSMGFPFESEDILEDSASAGRPRRLLMRGVNITEGEIRHTNDMDRFYCGDVAKLEKYILAEGDMVIGMDGSKVGRNSAIVGKHEAGSLLVQRVARIRALDGASLLYIYHHINSPFFHRYVDQVKTSSGIPHISAKQIREFTIGFPSLPEQTKIAGFLSALDGKIGAVGEQMRQTQAWKKGLLQQMFV